MRVSAAWPAADSRLDPGMDPSGPEPFRGSGRQKPVALCGGSANMDANKVGE